MNIRHWAVALVSVMTMAFAGLSLEKDEAPSTTLTVSETQVGFLLTGNWLYKLTITPVIQNTFER